MLENVNAVISIPPSHGKEECSKENKAEDKLQPKQTLKDRRLFLFSLGGLPRPCLSLQRCGRCAAGRHVALRCSWLGAGLAQI